MFHDLHTQLMAQLHRYRIELRLARVKPLFVFPRPHQFFGKRFTTIGVSAFRYSLYAGFNFRFFSFYLPNLTFYASILCPNLLLPFPHLQTRTHETLV
jgi:hypothetical protein